MDFILDWDIPCDVRLLDFVDDVGAYLYACLVNKKCCICGKPADLHHVDHVGAGRDREDIVHEGLEANLRSSMILMGNYRSKEARNGKE